jgi:hypothetical protein
LASVEPKEVAAEKWKPQIQIGDSRLPTGVPLPRPIFVRLSYGKPGLVYREQKFREGWTLPVGGQLIGPADLLSAPHGTKHGELEIAGKKLPVAEHAEGKQKGLMEISNPLPPAGPAPSFREMKVPEELLLVADPTGSHQSLSAARIKRTAEGWELDRSVPLTPALHGACAVATQDGKVVGILIVEEKQPGRIVAWGGE